MMRLEILKIVDKIAKDKNLNVFTNEEVEQLNTNFDPSLKVDKISDKTFQTNKNINKSYYHRPTPSDLQLD